MRLILKKKQKQYNSIIVCLLCFMFIPSAFTQQNISKHHQIMAGLLLHITSFTQWQKQESHSINLCILGDDLFEEYINGMVKRRPKTITGKFIVISHSQQITQASVKACQIIYADPKKLAQLWGALPAQHNILLVSHSKEFIDQGGMVNFVRDSKRVKLEVNLPAVLDAQLKLSSELLKHAKIISGNSHRKTSERETHDAN
jgi:hypothetical protein